MESTIHVQQRTPASSITSTRDRSFLFGRDIVIISTTIYGVYFFSLFPIQTIIGVSLLASAYIRFIAKRPSISNMGYGALHWFLQEKELSEENCECGENKKKVLKHLCDKFGLESDPEDTSIRNLIKRAASKKVTGIVNPLISPLLYLVSSFGPALIQNVIKSSKDKDEIEKGMALITSFTSEEVVIGKTIKDSLAYLSKNCSMEEIICFYLLNFSKKKDSLQIENGPMKKELLESFAKVLCQDMSTKDCKTSTWASFFFKMCKIRGDTFFEKTLPLSNVRGVLQIVKNPWPKIVHFSALMMLEIVKNGSPKELLRARAQGYLSILGQGKSNAKLDLEILAFLKDRKIDVEGIFSPNVFLIISVLEKFYKKSLLAVKDKAVAEPIEVIESRKVVREEKESSLETKQYKVDMQYEGKEQEDYDDDPPPYGETKMGTPFEANLTGSIPESTGLEQSIEWCSERAQENDRLPDYAERRRNYHRPLVMRADDAQLDSKGIINKEAGKTARLASSLTIYKFVESLGLHGKVEGYSEILSRVESDEVTSDKEFLQSFSKEMLESMKVQKKVSAIVFFLFKHIVFPLMTNTLGLNLCRALGKSIKELGSSLQSFESQESRPINVNFLSLISLLFNDIHTAIDIGNKSIRSTGAKSHQADFSELLIGKEERHANIKKLTKKFIGKIHIVDFNRHFETLLGKIDKRIEASDEDNKAFGIFLKNIWLALQKIVYPLQLAINLLIQKIMELFFLNKNFSGDPNEKKLALEFVSESLITILSKENQDFEKKTKGAAVIDELLLIVFKELNGALVELTNKEKQNLPNVDSTEIISLTTTEKKAIKKLLIGLIDSSQKLSVRKSKASIMDDIAKYSFGAGVKFFNDKLDLLAPHIVAVLKKISKGPQIKRYFATALVHVNKSLENFGQDRPADRTDEKTAEFKREEREKKVARSVADLTSNLCSLIHVVIEKDPSESLRIQESKIISAGSSHLEEISSMLEVFTSLNLEKNSEFHSKLKDLENRLEADCRKIEIMTLAKTESICSLLEKVKVLLTDFKIHIHYTEEVCSSTCLFENEELSSKVTFLLASLEKANIEFDEEAFEDDESMEKLICLNQQTRNLHETLISIQKEVKETLSIDPTKLGSDLITALRDLKEFTDPNETIAYLELNFREAITNILKSMPIPFNTFAANSLKVQIIQFLDGFKVAIPEEVKKTDSYGSFGTKIESLKKEALSYVKSINKKNLSEDNQSALKQEMLAKIEDETKHVSTCAKEHNIKLIRKQKEVAKICLQYRQYVKKHEVDREAKEEILENCKVLQHNINREKAELSEIELPIPVDAGLRSAFAKAFDLLGQGTLESVTKEKTDKVFDFFKARLFHEGFLHKTLVPSILKAF